MPRLLSRGRGNDFGEGVPLLGAPAGFPQYACPGCGSIQRSGNRARPNPSWMRCSRCRTLFIANRAQERHRCLMYIVGGSLLLGASVGLTIWSLNVAEHDHTGYFYCFYGAMAAGLFLMLRGLYGLVRLCRPRFVGRPYAARPEFEAAKNGDLATIQGCLTQGLDINTQNSLGMSLLQIAAQQGHLGVVSYLLSQGANPNLRSRSSNALLEATHNGHLAVVRELVTAGADDRAMTETVRPTGRISTTALSLAAVRGHHELVSFFLQRGHDPNASGQGSMPPLHCAAKGGFLHIISLLIQSNANPNLLNNFGSTPLHIAVLNNRPDAVRLLLQLGADPSLPNARGLRAIDLAKANNRQGIVGILNAPPGAYSASATGSAGAVDVPPPYSPAASSYGALSDVTPASFTSSPPGSETDFTNASAPPPYSTSINADEATGE